MGSRATLGLVVTLSALVFTAAPALAAPEFKASEVGKEFTEAEPGRTEGVGVGEQEFKFGAFKIRCTMVKTKGTVTKEHTKTMFLVAKYKDCNTQAKLGTQPIYLKTKFDNPWEFEYHANGFAEIGSESASELRLVSAGAIEMSVPAIKCLIEVPAQTVPVKAESKPENEFSLVSYTNEEVPVAPGKHFPSGVQKQLLVKNELKKMEYELSEGQCEDFKQTEGKNSAYNGALKVMVKNGNLSIGPAEESFSEAE